MMRKTMILMALALVANISAALAQNNPIRSEVRSLNGEKWWGLVVDNANYETPFSETFDIDMRAVSPLRFTANLLLSSKGRYVWSDEQMSVSFNGTTFQITTRKKGVEAERGGRSLRDAYLVSCHKHFAPSGINVSEKLFGSPIYELGGENSLFYTQQDVIDFAVRVLGDGMPQGTILIPIGWQSQSGGAVFDAENYPNPKAMVDYLHSKGMNVMLTVTPYVMASGRGFMRSSRDGRLLNDKNGNPMIFRSRMGYTACIDLSTDEAAELNSSLKKLQAETGIDGYYFDCLDVVPVLEGKSERLKSFLAAWVAASEGIDAAIYSQVVNIQLSTAVSAVSPARRTDWAALNEMVKTAVDGSVLGFSRASIASDLEFSAGDERLVTRTAQFSAMLPVVIVPYAVWSLTNLEPLKQMLAWRASVSDYMVATVNQSASTAEPIIRHLEYAFPNNGFANCDDQFMIGDSWLAAPVVDNSDMRMVRLPRGKWRARDGKIIRGPKVVNANLADGGVALYEYIK